MSFQNHENFAFDRNLQITVANIFIVVIEKCKISSTQLIALKSNRT